MKFIKAYISRHVHDYGKLTLPASKVRNILNDKQITSFCDVNNFVYDYHDKNITFIKIIRTCKTCAKE